MRTTSACILFVGLLAAGGVVLGAHQGPANAGQATKSAATAVINLNTATVAELDTLPGVGPTLAARIVEHRQKNGLFKKIEDLMTVKGIGEKQFLKLKPLVGVGPAKPAERLDSPHHGTP